MVFKFIKYCSLTSGVKPNIMWPSKEELKDLEEIEEMFEPKFEEMKQTLESQKKKEVEEKVKRYESFLYFKRKCCFGLKTFI